MFVHVVLLVRLEVRDEQEERFGLVRVQDEKRIAASVSVPTW